MHTTAFRDQVRRSGRAVLALLTGLVAGVLAVLLLVAWAVALVLSLVGIGIPLLLAVATVTRRFTAWERRRLGRVLDRLVSQRYREVPSPSMLDRFRVLVADTATWRDLAWVAVAATVGLALGGVVAYLALGAVNAITVPLWWWALPSSDPVTPLPGVVVTSWPRAALVPLVGLAYLAMLLCTPKIAHGYARWGERVLTPPRSVDLAERVDYLSRTRAEVLEAHGTELRRIERNLHDGLQARLVNVSMYLGLLDEVLAADHPGRMFAEQARGQTQVALTELRAVVRSIYPPILSDRGLVGALRTVAEECPVPCELVAESVGDLPAAVEAAAYFAATEALTNAVRHARPTRVRITVRRSPDVLTVQVRDDGFGGLEKMLATGVQGTGLAGIRTRLRAFDGAFAVTSPAGGPTEVTMELPCVW
ncbi:sensor histidine kinase [Streptoalloteichus hindustanus]|uniref:sensor histidine kinase n=1 Tax=Streptoalloteichus hindustanus TaxID=2017 RepID=UPI0013563671|nr:sensor histidine kinase [Streptoalloteichus hindustanus]